MAVGRHIYGHVLRTYDHRSGPAQAEQARIFLVNLFFGWTIIGWILALIWSVLHEERR